MSDYGRYVKSQGGPIPDDRKIDGIDLVPFTNGEAQREDRDTTHERLFWRSGASQTALVKGWKLNVSQPGEGQPTRKWLFDLRSDPTEQKDLSTTHPEKLAELEAALAAHNAEQAPSMWSSAMTFAVAIDKDATVAESPDDEYIYWSN